MFNTIPNNESIELRKNLLPEKKDSRRKKTSADMEESLRLKQPSGQEKKIQSECVFFAIELA